MIRNNETFEELEKSIGRELSIDEMLHVMIAACEARGNFTHEDAVAILNK